VPRRTVADQDIVGDGFNIIVTVQPPAAATTAKVEDPKDKAGNDHHAADGTSNNSVYGSALSRKGGCLSIVEAEVLV
jgi:hypothetical protein